MTPEETVARAAGHDPRPSWDVIGMCGLIVLVCSTTGAAVAVLAAWHPHAPLSVTTSALMGASGAWIGTVLGSVFAAIWARRT